MRKNYISIDTDKLESLASGLGRMSNDVMNTSENGKVNFSNVVKSGLMPNATSKIFSQMKTISDIFETGKTMVLNGVEKIVDVELLLNGNAEKIVVPKLSLVNSSSFNEEIGSVYLTKNDGMSINNDTNTNSQNIEFNSVVKYNEKLNSIVKNYESVNGVLEFNYSKKDNLINVNNSSFLNENKIDENTVIKSIPIDSVKFNDEKISIKDLEV